MLVYSVGRRLLYPVAKFLFRLRVYGAENIPKTGAFILCSNHKSVEDPVLLALKCPREIRYMAKSELFTDHGKAAAALLRYFRAFPVHRGKGDTESVRTALSILKGGQVLGIFPQGGCVFDNAPFKPKAGVALIAAKSQAPVLPACIYCDGRLKPFRRVTIRFGLPLSFQELFPEGGQKEELRRGAQLIAERINALLEEKH